MKPVQRTAKWIQWKSSLANDEGKKDLQSTLEGEFPNDSRLLKVVEARPSQRRI